MIKLFTAPWCTYCNLLKNALTDEDLEGVDVINIDHEPSYREQYNIRSIPTIIRVDEEGVELDRIMGSISRTAFLEFKNV